MKLFTQVKVNFMNMSNIFLSVLTAALCSGLISFSTTPIASFIAYRIGAVDVPKDSRRMHKKPIPRLGGLAVFFAFLVTTIVFCEMSPMILSLIVGGLLIVAVGVIDDIYAIPPYAKFIIQIIAAIFPIMQGITIDFFSIGGTYYNLGIWSKPVTLVWIVLLTNAINLIDGLDGLSCGVSAICALSLLLVTLVFGTSNTTVILCAILAGACLGFLPYNSNPAKIFIGDTGALFLGYTMSIISIGGVFKVHAMLSFIIPMSIFGLPLFDTIFAIIRRILHGQAPWHADRGHIHHKLIDLGFNQKQSVHFLYAVSAILGLSAVLFTRENLQGMLIIVSVSLFILFMNLYLITNKQANHQAGYDTESSVNSTSETGKTAEFICPYRQNCPGVICESDKTSGEIQEAEKEEITEISADTESQNTDSAETKTDKNILNT